MDCVILIDSQDSMTVKTAYCSRESIKKDRWKKTNAVWKSNESSELQLQLAA